MNFGYMYMYLGYPCGVCILKLFCGIYERFCTQIMICLEDFNIELHLVISLKDNCRISGRTYSKKKSIPS